MNSTGCRPATPAGPRRCTRPRAWSEHAGGRGSSKRGTSTGSADQQRARPGPGWRRWQDPVIAETGAGQHGVGHRHGVRTAGPGCVVTWGRWTPPSGHSTSPMRCSARVGGAVGFEDARTPSTRPSAGLGGPTPTTYYWLAAAGHRSRMMVATCSGGQGRRVRRSLRRPRTTAGLPSPRASAGIQRHQDLPRVHRRSGVRLIGQHEAGGDGVETGRHASTTGRIARGVPGLVLLCDAELRTVRPSRIPLISAGLDYPASGPSTPSRIAGRAEYRPITDAQAMDAFGCHCAGLENIIPPSSRPTR